MKGLAKVIVSICTKPKTLHVYLCDRFDVFITEMCKTYSNNLPANNDVVKGLETGPHFGVRPTAGSGPTS